MSETVLMLADCPDAVTVTHNGATTSALWLMRVQNQDGDGRMLTQVGVEHLVIAAGSLPGLAKKSLIKFQENEDYGGAIHERRVTEIRPKDDDRALVRVMLEEI